MNIHGAKKGGGKQRQPIIAPDSAQSKTFISIMYGLGEGEIAGLANGYKSVYLEDTPLQNDNGEFNFADVKVDFRTGTNDQEYIDGFPDVASETAVNVELKHGTPFVKAFNNLDLDALRVRLKWGALRQQNRENGDVSGVKIDYAIDVKTDNGGWVEVLNTSINAKTSDAYERSHRIDLPKAQTGWQLRVRRITPNSTSEFISDKMFIAAISEVIDLKLRYPNTALLGLRYDAESFSNVAKMSARCKGLIIKVPTNYDPVARTYTGMWDGQFKMAYSNNPAWVYYDLCTAERYGLGGRLTQSMIDKWSLYRLAQYCDEMVDDGMGGQEPRFTVNVYIQSADGAFELLSRLAGVFRAISYWDGNSIVLDADIPQDSIYSFSRANVIDGVFEYTGTRSRDRRTVAKVAWDNPANHFKTEYEYVRDEKAIAKFGVRVADIAAWGCTSRGQAQRAGLWALKSEQLETRMVTFKVGLDGLIPAPAKVIEISDELFAGRATGGRVLAINKTKTTITLDRPITAKAGDTLVINGDDGTSQRRLIKSVSGDKVTVTKAFANISVENVWVLDSQDLATMKFRVLSVTADENHQFTITAVQYNPAKYDAIDHGAYTPERPISVINPTVQAPTKSVTLSSYHTVNQGVSITTLVISWEQVAGAVKYAVEWRKDNGNWQTLPPTGTNSIEIAGVYAGQYEARVTAISAFGQASLATHSNLTEIQGKVGKPNRPAFIRATGVLFGMELAWGFGAKSDDTNFTEIQVSPDGRSNITTLGTFAYPTNKHERRQEADAHQNLLGVHMSFHTYNRAGQKLLDSDELVFNFVMSGRLTRLLDKPFEANKRVYSHRAKRLIINSRVRTTVADIYSPEYCMYYIDVPRAVSPLCAIYYDDLAENCNPVVYLNTGYVGSTARMMFYSNGRLSDAELAKFQIYIFDVVATEKETTVGMNLYDREGNVTFSSRSQPMSVHTKYVYDSIPDSYAYVTKREASLTEYGYFSRSKWEDYYYLSKGNHKSEMWNRLNSGTRIRDLVPSTINSKSAGLPSAKVRYLRYYPATAAELAGYIISINNGGLPNPVEGDLFPTLGGHYTHMANKHVLTHTPILTAIGCSDKPAVLFSVPFDDIKRDGTVRHGGTLPDSRRVIFTGRTSFDFVDIQNLPFPFTRRPS